MCFSLQPTDFMIALTLAHETKSYDFVQQASPWSVSLLSQAAVTELQIQKDSQYSLDNRINITDCGLVIAKFIFFRLYFGGKITFKLLLIRSTIA